MSSDLSALYDVIEGTWPPARAWPDGPWTLRDGAGGGKRASAATATGEVTDADIDTAQAAMRETGQQALFMIRNGDDALDDMLAARGYERIDETNIYTAPVDLLTDKAIPRVTCFTIWEPLAIMLEIWAKGGIGATRLDVMRRAQLKTGIFARWNEQPGGVAFVGIHNDTAMVHAVEVLPHHRKQGLAEWIMRAAAIWAAKQGATQVAVLCVADNKPANALYTKLGFARAGTYHYRILPE
ncbi:GNAT family N-acetyltransferase [Sulfitobacter sp. F26169L]|uniref:GNAT family N-acetyltransferase n=1 Tax=Sulfitobacter sp. F26169L TaxID=2996015 RepID=UPI002260BB96|nr:GNAT family N-acetyltransferase [Sulfitobacter sp. F26169L]MCX7566614.1 GNAT family N-acetyltransferase [Sulfitobacter sp. F26169L]